MTVHSMEHTMLPGRLASVHVRSIRAGSETGQAAPRKNLSEDTAQDTTVAQKSLLDEVFANVLT